MKNGICAAFLAQSVEHETLNLRVVGSTPTESAFLIIMFKTFISSRKYYLDYCNDTLISELSLLDAILWKFKNMLSRQLFYKKLEHVKRCTRNLMNHLKSFLNSCDNMNNLSLVITTLKSTLSVILNAYDIVSSVISRGQQLSLMLALVAILSRMYSICLYCEKTFLYMKEFIHRSSNISIPFEDEDLGEVMTLLR